ncbi:hypothetical protein ACIB24_08985 [Spongisporangium articulatum]|uniref:ABC transporter permease n=1 Tax=Spongisporangium articulatum TaxID=3362603 RepID=A0ABW8AM73_9ACTN
MSTATSTAPPVLGVLARQEIRNYLRSKLFWAGTALVVALTVSGFVDRGASYPGGNGPSSALDMVAVAALLGVFGLIVTAGLTRRSDRAAEAAGSVAVPERTRTLALAAAVVVPLAVALAWFVAALVNFHTDPPADYTVPFGPIDTGFVYAAMFAQGVVPAVGGPVLGLVIARWLPQRGITALSVVLLVLVTILLQGNFRATWRWQAAWPWTNWYGPLGWNTGEGHWIALPGSPQAWIAYLLALCVLGVLVAVWHDPEADRSRLRAAIAGTVVVAIVALVLTMTLGLPDAAFNPVVAPTA